MEGDRQGPLDGIVNAVKGFFNSIKGAIQRNRGEEGEKSSPAEPRLKLNLDIKMLILVVLAITAVFVPFLVAHFFQNGDSQPPGWFAVGRFSFGLGNFQTPANAQVIIADWALYLPWLIWLVNVPLLLWQLRRERKLAKDISDFWLVLVAAVIFWFVRVFPEAVGQIGSGMAAWFSGGPPIPWGVEALVPVAGIVCVVVAYWATTSGSFDLTPLSVMLVILAVIYHAYDGGDSAWAKLALGIGLVVGLVEVMRQPLKNKGDRAGALSLVLGAVILFLALRGLINWFIQGQIELVTNPPGFFVDLGRTLYANASLVSLILAAVIAWGLRWQVGNLLAGAVIRFGPKDKGLERLLPHQGVRFYDSTLLAHFALLALWLFVGL